VVDHYCLEAASSCYLYGPREIELRERSIVAVRGPHRLKAVDRTAPAHEEGDTYRALSKRNRERTTAHDMPHTNRRGRVAAEQDGGRYDLGQGYPWLLSAVAWITTSADRPCRAEWQVVLQADVRG
jgi:hypothetical protein